MREEEGGRGKEEERGEGILFPGWLPAYCTCVDLAAADVGEVGGIEVAVADDHQEVQPTSPLLHGGDHLLHCRRGIDTV